MAAVLIVLAGCSAGAPSSPAPSCQLPWDSVDQIFACKSPNYTVARREGDAVVHIIVATDDPEVIAAALAHAWNEIPFYEESVVWAWSSRRRIGRGYDRGVLSEQGIDGERLVFEICAASDCSEKIKFTIRQD